VGGFGLNYAATFLFANDFTPFEGDTTVERAGFFVGQAGIPRAEYRHRILGTWDTPIEGWDATITWRHTGGVENEADPDSEIEGSLSAANYFDVSTSYEFLDGITARAGVNNIFERDFPLSVSSGPGNGGNNNTFPGIYDTGRFVFFGVNVKL